MPAGAIGVAFTRVVWVQLLHVCLRDVASICLCVCVTGDL